MILLFRPLVMGIYLLAASEVPERLVVPCDANARYFEALRRVAARYLEDDALRPLLGMKVIVDARGSVGAAYARFLEALQKTINTL